MNDSRSQIAADALGSVRAEGLEPGTAVVKILDHWVLGTVDTEQLGEAAHRVSRGESVEDLVDPPVRASSRR
jgi:Antitoxin VbhA